MNTKQKIAIVAGMGILALAGGFVAGPRIIRSVQALINGSEGVKAGANWVNQGTTVAEMSSQADLIVRVRVINSETRELRETLPVYAEDAKTVIGEKEFVTPFTDSQMQVLEVYKGSAEDAITVMQTGGLPEAVDVNATPFSIEGDPIFTPGSEHILFLTDITNDGVHSTGRKLYVIVNPFGRYELKDGGLITPADVMVEDGTISSDLPKSLDELVNQIRQSVKN